MTTRPAAHTPVIPPGRPGRLHRVGCAARRHPFAAAGAIVVATVLVMALFSPWLAPDAVQQAHRGEQLTPPGRRYPLGTDHLGRDILSRIIYGAQVTVLAGAASAALTAFVALVVGGLSGYARGWPDIALQRLVDVWMSFPAILLILTLVTVLAPTGDGYGLLGLGRGPDWGPDPRAGDWIWHTAPRTTIVILVLGVVAAGGLSRILRSAVLEVAAAQYITAARATGAGHGRILLHHVLPNILPALVVLATLQLGAAILAEATLSYLGVGVTNFPTWGQMLSGQARVAASGHPHVVIFPGLAIVLTVFAFNVLGDALRDALDPRL